MPTSISIDALLEYFLWMVILYILPNFVSAGIITAVMNSSRSRALFENLIEVLHKNVNDLTPLLEKVKR